MFLRFCDRALAQLDHRIMEARIMEALKAVQHANLMNRLKAQHGKETQERKTHLAEVRLCMSVFANLPQNERCARQWHTRNQSAWDLMGVVSQVMLAMLYRRAYYST